MVIPHRRNRTLLERALHSVQGYPVIVVDDTDDGLDLDVAKVRLGGGQGFTRAANAGLDAVRTPWAVLLNDDAMPMGDCVAQMARVGGLCGPILVGPGGVESCGFEVRSWGRVLQRRVVPERDVRVAAVSGCCMGMPASARFDSRWVHGFEDVELGRRMGGAVLVAGAVCWHEGGASVPRDSVEAQRHAFAGQARLFGGWRVGVVAALHAAQVLREGPLGRMRGIAAGWGDLQG